MDLLKRVSNIPIGISRRMRMLRAMPRSVMELSANMLKLERMVGNSKKDIAVELLKLREIVRDFKGEITVELAFSFNDLSSRIPEIESRFEKQVKTMCGRLDTIEQQQRTMIQCMEIEMSRQLLALSATAGQQETPVAEVTN